MHHQQLTIRTAKDVISYGEECDSYKLEAELRDDIIRALPKVESIKGEKTVFVGRHPSCCQNCMVAALRTPSLRLNRPAFDIWLSWHQQDHDHAYGEDGEKATGQIMLRHGGLEVFDLHYLRVQLDGLGWETEWSGDPGHVIVVKGKKRLQGFTEAKEE